MAILVNNPNKDPRVGSDKLSSVATNYLDLQWFPTSEFQNAYMQVLKETTGARVADGRIYYALAQALQAGTDGSARHIDKLHASDVLKPYLDERGDLVGYDKAIAVAGSDAALANTFGLYLRDAHLPAEILVSTYQQSYDSCLKKEQ